MDHLFTGLGWMFISLTILFLLGLLQPFARYFYPGSPGVVRRAAAPILFACIAGAFFAGAGLPALVVLTLLGIVLIGASRRSAVTKRSTVRR